MDLYAQTVKITPHDKVIYSLSQKSPGFNTFPRKSVSRKQSMEHIYDEIPSLSDEITSSNRTKSEKIDDLTTTDSVYENQESIEKTKMWEIVSCWSEMYFKKFSENKVIIL